MLLGIDMEGGIEVLDVDIMICLGKVVAVVRVEDDASHCSSGLRRTTAMQA